MRKYALATKAVELSRNADSLEQLYSDLDDIITPDEYQWDRILYRARDVLREASKLSSARKLSPEEYQDCLAMAAFLSDGLITLSELSLKLASRVNGGLNSWESKWKEGEPYQLSMPFVEISNGSDKR